MFAAATTRGRLGSLPMAIDPRGADLKRLLADDDGGPVVMLNLLRFTDNGLAS